MMDGSYGSWAVYYEEREYPAGTSDSRLQLWEGENYHDLKEKKDTTAEVEARAVTEATKLLKRQNEQVEGEKNDHEEELAQEAREAREARERENQSKGYYNLSHGQ
jgi:hypothetical protein